MDKRNSLEQPSVRNVEQWQKESDSVLYRYNYETIFTRWDHQNPFTTAILFENMAIVSDMHSLQAYCNQPEMMMAFLKNYRMSNGCCFYFTNILDSKFKGKRYISQCLLSILSTINV
ncbi:unnamed protein product [Rangifer tarandus platyrhynchus]|uniref:Uncharacterized protein n=2 Tax=Rangifer tarandus platyrhynchus TaxID=3082113 RepID=A0AC59ZTA6_RANTA|nr:unnamed protein product [Rangifer tarandus platyrhynchus]